MSSGGADGKGRRALTPEMPLPQIERPVEPGMRPQAPLGIRWPLPGQGTGQFFRGRYDTLAITGIPGSGKTTLATLLSTRLGWPVLSTGDIARVTDPACLTDGTMAEERTFAELFRRRYEEARHTLALPLILDGIPRSKVQLAYLDGNSTRVLLLTARRDVAMERLLRRGRADDTLEIATRRLREQGALLEIDDAQGWTFQIAGFYTSVNTTYKTPPMVAEDVFQYLAGYRTEAF